MIDIEAELFTIVAKKLREKFPGIFVVGENVKAPPKFPCVSFVEANNATYTKSQDSQSNENHATLMYELNVYSNRKNGKKSECKAIASLVDSILLELNFTRLVLNQMPNLEDATIYRILGRYEANVSKDKVIFRR